MIEYSKYRYFITNPRISGQRTYLFPLKPLGANEIKLPESDDFMEFKSRLTTSASLNIGSANVMLLEISPSL
jgi:hypothetical protein